jgi:hypothetical protein
MKKINFCLSLGFILGALFCSLEGTSNDQIGARTSSEKKGDQSTTQQKFEIMERDENEDTDVLAIPLDDSEVEDEEEIDELEEEDDDDDDTFDLPHSHSS